MKKIRSLSLTHLCAFVYRARARVLNRTNRDVRLPPLRMLATSERAYLETWRFLSRESAFPLSMRLLQTTQRDPTRLHRYGWKTVAGKASRQEPKGQTGPADDVSSELLFRRCVWARSTLEESFKIDHARNFREFRECYLNCSSKRTLHSTFHSLASRIPNDPRHAQSWSFRRISHPVICRRHYESFLTLTWSADTFRERCDGA